MTTDPEQFIARVLKEEATDLAERGIDPLYQEVTRLESGQLLRHHSKEMCLGFCCLHGTSPHFACRQRRHWHVREKVLMHECGCGFFHPCAGTLHTGRLTHECCGREDHCGHPEPEPPTEAVQLEPEGLKVCSLTRRLNTVQATVATQNEVQSLMVISLRELSRRLTTAEKKLRVAFVAGVTAFAMWLVLIAVAVADRYL